MNTRLSIQFVITIFICVSQSFAQWTQMSQFSNENIMTLAIKSDGSIFVGTYNDGVYRSTDSGSSWSLVLGQLLNVYEVYSLAYDPSGNVYAGTHLEGLLRSTDNGHAWGWLSSDISPDNLPQSDIYAVAVSSSGTIFASDAGDMYRSTDNGTTWMRVKPTSYGGASGFRTIAFGGGDTIYIGATGDGFLGSTNNGTNWYGQTNGLNKTPYVLAAKSGGLVFAGTQGSGVFKSTDYGANWTQVISGLSNLNVNTLSIDAGGIIYAGTHLGGVFTSTNNGGTWVAASNGLTNLDIYALAFSPSSKAYAGAYTGTVHGGLWQSSMPLPIQLVSFSALEDRGAVVLRWNTLSEVDNYGFQVERSTRAVGGYQIVSGLIPGHGTTNVPQSYLFTDKTVVAAGLYYYRLDNIDLNSTVYYNDPIKVEIKTGGQGRALPESFELQTNYPNPFNPTTQIGYALPVPSWVTLKVFDALGREVSTLVDQAKSEGSHFAEFNGSAFPSGSYYYRIFAHPLSGAKTAEFTATKKLLLIR